MAFHERDTISFSRMELQVRPLDRLKLTNHAAKAGGVGFTSGEVSRLKLTNHAAEADGICNHLSAIH